MPDPSLPIHTADTQPITVEPPPRSRSRRLRNWIGGIVAVLILAGAALSYLRDRPAAVPGTETLGGFHAAKTIPPTLRPYYDRAMAGDASAMRMLGTMYYNGLNVPQDPKEGIRWYRKAAAAGSVAAGKDLEQLGLAPQ
ncbi:MAG: SEL1-like repeat protein [Holophaga sp.]|nr:SEL1-like repeat protein [Holophaga sp.]